MAAVVPAVLVAIPVLAILNGILDPNTEVWSQQWDTRLPGAIWSTLVLGVGVCVLTVVMGVGLAWLVAGYDFPGRRVLAWALVLPLAVPAYILGFVTTSVLGVAGPLQTRWRDVMGADAWFPEVRSMPVAIAVFSFTLYPYVYLLARAALRDQAGSAFAVARTLGAGRAEAFRRVLLPMLRPAIAAGAAIVAMETLTDFATVQYFQVDTVTAVVYRIWTGTYDRDAAAEIATLALGFAVLAIALERIFRGRARYAEMGRTGLGLQRERLRGVRAWGASAVASGVVLVGFGLPTAQLVSWAIDEQTGTRGTPQLERYQEYLGNSLVLTGTTVALCLVIGSLIANAGRFSSSRGLGVARRTATVGYALPGAVIAMGVVLALVGLDRELGRFDLTLPGTVATGSFIALVYAYAVRFLAPAVNSLESGLDQVPRDLSASARSLGAGPLRIVRRIHLPLSRASVISAAVLVGVDALKELPVALLLRPIGFDTLPVWVYNLASESRFQQAALPSLTIIAVAMAPVVILCWRLERGPT